MKPLEQQTVLITGATDGLGRALALDLAARGATVLIHGRDPGRVADTVQIMFTVDLARELAGTGVTANCLHPATYMPTKIVSSPISTLAEGVRATSRLLTDPDLDEVSGEFFDGTRRAEADEQAYDATARTELRALSDRLTSSFSAPER